MTGLASYPPRSARQPALLTVIASSLALVLDLPPAKRDPATTRNYLITYAKQSALDTLENLIWESSDRPSKDQRLIKKRSAVLAQSSQDLLDLPVLLDLSVVYARTNPTQLQALFAASAIPSTIISEELVPGFTALISQQNSASHGLYSQRKLAECIICFLIASKSNPAFVRPFSCSKSFILALATQYESGLSNIATSYGGVGAIYSGISDGRAPDDWERIWVETKAALLDSFHIILKCILSDLASARTGPALTSEAERAFEVIFALLDLPSPSSATQNALPPTPFLNRPLLVDYQEAYSLSKTLATALKHAEEKDARLDVLESTLQSFENTSHAGESPGRRPGALKILLKSSGIQPGIDNLGNRNRPSSNDKGKGKSVPTPSEPTAPANDPELDLKATQVLDILPDLDIDYVRSLLLHDRFGGNPECVVEGLLEGTAPSAEEVKKSLTRHAEQIVDGRGRLKGPVFEERRNVFDDEIIDVSKVQYGKKTTDSDEILRDRTYIEEMKAEILRRAEAVSDSESETENVSGLDKGKGKMTSFLSPDASVIFDDDDPNANVPVLGDGEESGAESSGDDEGGGQARDTPEGIIERAYLANAAAFNRDARKSKARNDLKAQTGWSDEQIEGWRTMLDKDPRRKARLGEKYEFRGNEKGLEVHVPSGDLMRGGRPRGGGRGRGGRGRGRGGGGAGGSGGSDAGQDANRERAWKDKNKSSQANHNRKRGHDKKMARAGPGPAT